MSDDKIKKLGEISGIVSELKGRGKRIVHCHGCFDTLHIGHIKHFQDAKKQGDVLVVTLTPDRFVNKGPHSPFFTENLRAEHIAALACVDYVAINEWETAEKTILTIKPDVYAKGREVLNNAEVDKKTIDGVNKSYLAAEEEVLRSVGGSLYLTEQPTFSSSRLINAVFADSSDEARSYFSEMKQRHSSEGLIRLIESLRTIRPIIIGDAIIDEYIFCESLEKAGKEPIVAFCRQKGESHLGGVLAVANHAAGFVDSASLITCIGEKESESVSGRISGRISQSVFTNNLETLTKTRFLHNHRKYKLFEIYSQQESPVGREIEEKVMHHVEEKELSSDMIIVADFGHGMISDRLAKFLSQRNKYLAVNTQLNAGNSGYNFITKYPRADFVSLSERELRLPMQNQRADISHSMRELGERLGLKSLNVTLGKSGDMYMFSDRYYFAPAFTNNTVDTIGAGDAVFTLTSLLSYHSAEPELIPFFANSIGALAVKIMGNEKQISSEDLNKFIKYSLK
jgi:cytidyltransferase-like protein